MTTIANLTACRILLISQVFVGCQQKIEPASFGCCQKIAVTQFVPPLLRRRADAVVRKIRTDRNRRCLIEEDPHGRGQGA